MSEWCSRPGQQSPKGGKINILIRGKFDFLNEFYITETNKRKLNNFYF
jgi:hypothetical protein